jgi:hypothetical protein
MALTTLLSTDYGFDLPDCYSRVEQLSLISKDKISFVVCYYASKNHAAFCSKHHTCPYNLSGANPLEQAYLHLKSLPEFADAVDC